VGGWRRRQFGVINGKYLRSNSGHSRQWSLARALIIEEEGDFFFSAELLLSFFFGFIGT